MNTEMVFRIPGKGNLGTGTLREVLLAGLQALGHIPAELDFSPNKTGLGIEVPSDRKPVDEEELTFVVTLQVSRKKAISGGYKD